MDDFHLIHSQPILDSLANLLEHMRHRCTWCSFTHRPALPLSRLRARNQLVKSGLINYDLRMTRLPSFLTKGWVEAVRQ